jgi:4-hydroxyphenylacetate 3-monooxygenase
MFYAGARFVTCGHSFRTFDWDDAIVVVDSLLSSYDLQSELNRVKR